MSRNGRLLVVAPWAVVLVTVLAACGTNAGPALQFDAAAYDAAAGLQPADAGLVSLDAASKPGTAVDESAAASPVTGQATVSDGSARVQPAHGTPDTALREASFTLVTVEADEGEQVIFVPSEDYEKVCPHRLRMASEFSDVGAADF